MATYPVKNKETGETKEVKMSIHDWDQWCEDNPDWERYYTPDNAPKLGLEMGEPFETLHQTSRLERCNLNRSRSSTWCNHQTLRLILCQERVSQVSVVPIQSPSV